MIKIAFVVLNYGTFQETKECIESIRNHLDIAEYKVIVVDNASKDNSVEMLKAEFSDDFDVDIIENHDNLGFARGNNVGIRYALDKYSPEFIVVNNSDTEIFQDDLYQKLISEYKKSCFALLGPMMLLSDGTCNGSPWEPATIQGVKEKLIEKRKEKQMLDSVFYYLLKCVEKVRKSISRNHVTNDQLHTRLDFWKYQTQVELQGAFLVFSKTAFDYIDGFDERTFLYYEEQLLYLSLIKHNQTIVYDPRIAVLHKGAIATKKARKSKIVWLRFINKCNLESLEILYKTMIEMKGQK